VVVDVDVDADVLELEVLPIEVDEGM